MLLFARIGQTNPDRLDDALAFSVEMTAYASKVGGLEVHLWTPLYGLPLGGVSWTTLAESQAAMGAAAAKLQADSGYMDRIRGAAGLFVGAPTDGLSEIIHAVNPTTDLGSYASVVRAECAPGKIGEAMAWGVDIMSHVGSITGLPGFFSRVLYGPWASVTWITISKSLEEVDAATAAMSADASYLGKVDSGGSLFRDGSASQVLTQRIV